MHEVLVNSLGGLSLPRKSVVRLTDRADMTLVVYRGRKTTIQYNNLPMTKHLECGSFPSCDSAIFKDGTVGCHGNSVVYLHHQ